MTTDEILDDLLQREGGHRAEVRRPDGTIDPETVRGITWPTYQKYCRDHDLGEPTSDGFLQLTAEQARNIYVGMFIVEPGFTRENVPFEPLRVQLIDFGVNSSPARAIRWLQRAMLFRGADVTGVMDKPTTDLLYGLGTLDGTPLLAMVNDALVAARLYMIDRAVDQGRIRKVDEEGLESRALGFFLARP